MDPIKQALRGGRQRRGDIDELPLELSQADETEDTDVRSEREAVEARHASMGSASTTAGLDPIDTVRLRKVYKGGKVAVANSSFSIKQGECFGLLGPNGAGKTTTISMWTGLYPPTSGTAFICGFDMRTQMDKIYQKIGVCPQFDILWPLLTVLETLVFYLQVPPPCSHQCPPSSHQCPPSSPFSVGV